MSDQIPNQSKVSILSPKKIALGVIGAILGVIVISALIMLILKLTAPKKPSEPTKTVKNGPIMLTQPKQIDFQLTINQWLANQPNKDNSSVLIYDLDNNVVVARHNEDKVFPISSLSSMFAVYEGYYRIDHNIWKSSDQYPKIPKDYAKRPYTKILCLLDMVRFSHQDCQNAVESEIGLEQLQASYNAQGFSKTSLREKTSTSSELLKLYQLFWKHSNLTAKSWEHIQESMLTQSADTINPIYNQNWRQGLPSGFVKAEVYNKSGWITTPNNTNTYQSLNHASFIVFPKTIDKENKYLLPERHFIVIALTKDTPTAELVKLGRSIENTVRSNDNY